MPDDNAAPQPNPQPINPGPTPTGYQRTQGGSFKWVPPTAQELSKLLPQYEVEALVGRGGMGAVYKGKQKRLDRAVAIKILPPEVDAEDDSYTIRFQNEAKIMAKLEHPAIVPVYDFGETSTGLLYFVMSFIDGTDVHQMIQSQGRLPPEHALAITAHVCDALRYAHEHGVIHRDIKPSNVLINMEGQVKVADFGLAKVDDPLQSSGLTKTGLAMGTPDYVAPETLTLGMTVDGRADLYAVGVMLYQMLTGRVPRGTYEAPSKLCGCDPRFDAIAFKAMKYDREDRYDTAAALRKDLDVILTTPLVQSGGKASAAIPQQSLPQKPVAKGPQKPMGKSANVPVDGRRVRQNAEDAANTPDRTLASAPTAKSKTPLFIGIGAVAAIAVGAFVMMGGKKPDVGDDVRSLTSSSAASEPQRLVTSSPTPAAPIKVREDPKPANSVTSSPLPVTKSPSAPAVSQVALPSISPTGWQPLFTQAEWRVSDDDREFVDGLLHVKRRKLLPRAQPSADGAIRARIIYREGTRNPFVVARSTESDGHYVLGLGTDAKHVFLGYFKTLNSEGNILARHFLPRPLASGDGLSLELILQGDRLIGLVDGTPVIDAHDTHLKQPGRWGIYAASGWFESVEVQPLSALANAVASATPAASSPSPSVSKSSAAPASSSPSVPVSKSSAPTFPPGQWVKVFTKIEDLPEGPRKKDMKFEDGWLINESNDRNPMHLPDGLGNNCAIRMRIRRGAGKTAYRSIALRVGGRAMYGLQLDTTFKCSYIVNAATGTSISNLPVPVPEIGNEYTLEFAVLGNRLFGRYNTKLLVNAVNNTLPNGIAYVSGIEPVRDIEVINLDGLPEAEALRILGVDEKGNDLRALAAKQEQQKAEQAKQADAMAAIPELKTLHEQFVKLQAERVTAPFEADVAKLNTGYLGGLDREIEKDKKAGHLDGVIVLEAEKKLIAVAGVSDPGPPGSLSRATAPGSLTPATMNPLPAEDDDATPANLKGLRKIYRDAFAKLEATRAANLKALTDPLSIRLKQLESTLTQKNRVPDAKVVREYRENLGKEGSIGSADTPVRNPTAGGEAATTKEAGKSGPAPLKKFPRGDDRKAAEWVLDLGGWVRILEGKTERRIDKKEDLPKRSFDLVALKLSSEAAAKRVIDYTDLTPLAGLRQLNSIDFAGMPVTDADCDVLASLPELARLTISKTDGFTGSQLGKLKHLDKLTYLYLGETGITAEGVAAIGELSNLEYLRLTPTKFGDADIAPLAKLKKLSDLLLSRGQLTLEGWKKLKGLFIRGYLGFSPQAGQMQQWCEELAKLFPAAHRLEVSCDDVLSADDIAALGKFAPTRVTLSNAMTSDAVVAAIATLPKLDQVYLSSGPKGGGLPGVTDASLAALASHKAITMINFTDVGSITADGLLKLTALKTLKALELIRCRQLDAPAADALKKARPDVRVSVE